MASSSPDGMALSRVTKLCDHDHARWLLPAAKLPCPPRPPRWTPSAHQDGRFPYSPNDGGVRVVQRFGRGPPLRTRCAPALYGGFKLIKGTDVPLAKLYREAIASPRGHDPMRRDVKHLQVMVQSGDERSSVYNQYGLTIVARANPRCNSRAVRSALLAGSRPTIRDWTVRKYCYYWREHGVLRSNCVIGKHQQL